MATTYSGSIKFNLKGYLTKALDIGTGTIAIDYNKSYTQTNGTGADQCNMIWTDTRTLTASSTEDLDLYGVLTNAFGDTMSFTCIKGIFISAATANTNNVLVGGDANGLIGWVGNANDIVSVKPGGLLAYYNPSASGDAVTNTTGDILQIANSSSGTSVTYDIIVLGEV